MPRSACADAQAGLCFRCSRKNIMKLPSKGHNHEAHPFRGTAGRDEEQTRTTELNRFVFPSKDGTPVVELFLHGTVERSNGTFVPVASPVSRGNRFYLLTEFVPTSGQANTVRQHCIYPKNSDIDQTVVFTSDLGLRKRCPELPLFTPFSSILFRLAHEMYRQTNLLLADQS